MPTPTHDVLAAITRLFRSYESYLKTPCEDSLISLLGAMHSLDDRLKPSYGRLFFNIEEYVALKALRNLFHHSREPIVVEMLKPNEGWVTDLGVALLISKETLSCAVDGTASTFRAQAASAVEVTIPVYGNVADLNPCIFNCMVKILEELYRKDLLIATAEINRFVQQYNIETLQGRSHYVTGSIGLHAVHASSLSARLEALYRAGAARLIR